MKISEAFEGENSSLRKAYDEAVAPQTNMENKEEKHGWDKNGGVYHCSDGTHSSWWLSIAKTPQWEAWYKYASKNMLYDVDECLECGWMSEQHAKDFMDFIDKQGYMRALEDVEKALPKPKTGTHVFEVGYSKCRLCGEPRILIDRQTKELTRDEKSGGSIIEVTENRIDQTDFPCSQNSSIGLNSCLSQAHDAISKLKEKV